MFQGRREGGGQIAPGPEVLGAPEQFFVGPQSFLCVKYFHAKDKISVFLAKYRNLAWKIEIKSLENNYNVLVRKNFWPKKLSTGGDVSEINFFRKKILNRGPWKKICPGPPPTSWRPWYVS
jgi:hypothetical protein